MPAKPVLKSSQLAFKIAMPTPLDLPSLAQHWCILMPHTAIDTRTGLRFDARTASLMHTPEFLDWHDLRTRSHARNDTAAVVPLARMLAAEVAACEAELRALIDAGLVNYKRG